MVALDVLYNDLEQESDWDVYGKDYVESLIEDDAIKPEEAGFLKGYDEFSKKTRNDTKDDVWYDKQFI